MTELEQIRHGYNDGQTIFRRQSVEVLLARIEELENLARWIPVDEATPYDNGDVLAVHGESVDFWYHIDGYWIRSDGKESHKDEEEYIEFWKYIGNLPNQSEDES